MCFSFWFCHLIREFPFWIFLGVQYFCVFTFYNQIKNNNFLFWPQNDTGNVLVKNIAREPKKWLGNFSRLFISCHSRHFYLEYFFIHKNQTAPPSLSQDVSWNSCIKSLQMGLLETFCDLLIQIRTHLSLVGQQWLIPGHKNMTWLCKWCHTALHKILHR